MSLHDRYADFTPLDAGPLGPRYRARHKVLGRPVIVRLISPESTEDQRTALFDALRRLASLVHPGIVAVIDADDDPAQPYYVSEDAAGGTLKERLTGTPLDARTVGAWGSALCAALRFAHERGVLHRGISPARVAFDAVGTPRLSDFGLSAGFVDSQRGQVALEADATPYLPFRVFRNPASYDAEADRYGLGALLFELFTGRPPEPGGPGLENLRSDLPFAAASSLSRLLQSGASAEDLAMAESRLRELAGSDAPVRLTGAQIAAADTGSRSATHRAVSPLSDPLPTLSADSNSFEGPDVSAVIANILAASQSQAVPAVHAAQVTSGLSALTSAVLNPVRAASGGTPPPLGDGDEPTESTTRGEAQTAPPLPAAAEEHLVSPALLDDSLARRIREKLDRYDGLLRG